MQFRFDFSGTFSLNTKEKSTLKDAKLCQKAKENRQFIIIVHCGNPFLLIDVSVATSHFLMSLFAFFYISFVRSFCISFTVFFHSNFPGSHQLFNITTIHYYFTIGISVIK